MIDHGRHLACRGCRPSSLRSSCGERWRLWTPEGYYASSPGAAAVLGWHVNRGWDQSADFYPITAYGGFYQAKALPLVLQQLDVARALGLAKIAYDREQVQQAVNSPAPPGPQLHVLAVGISQYEHGDLKLDFAADDARDLTKALLGQEGALYAKVDVQALTDDKASRRECYGPCAAFATACRSSRATWW